MISNINSFCPVGIGGVKNVDTQKTKLFIGNLPVQVSSQDLYDHFVQYGEIREAVVIPDRFRVRSRCYGFVTFVEEAITKHVISISKASSIELNGNILSIILASTNVKPKRSQFERYSINHNNKNKNACVYKEASSLQANDGNNASTNDKLIHEEFGLYRTANIQTILPATLYTPPKIKKLTTGNIKKKLNDPNDNSTMVNNDIAFDYRKLLQINYIKENNSIASNGNIQYKNRLNPAQSDIKLHKSPKRKQSTCHENSYSLESPKKRSRLEEDDEKRYILEETNTNTAPQNNVISLIQANTTSHEIIYNTIDHYSLDLESDIYPSDGDDMTLNIIYDINLLSVTNTEVSL